MADQETLRKRVERLAPDLAEKMRTEPTVVTPYPSDFLQRGAIYHVASNGRYGPALFTLGIVEPDFAVALGNNPAGFYQLAAKAGLALDTPEQRQRYVATFLDTTKDLLKRTQFLAHFPDLRRTPQPTPQELERYRALEEKYGSVVKPLTLALREPWKGAAFALVMWDLVRYDVTLSADGKVAVATTTLEKNLPLGLDLENTRGLVVLPEKEG